MKIYYAHHIWKYGTEIEKYELNLIKKIFPNSDIFNPSIDIDQTKSEDEIMEDCFDAVSESDIVIFSSMNGCIGRGVFREIRFAYQNNIKVGYLFADKIQNYGEEQFEQISILNNETPRVYAIIN